MDTKDSVTDELVEATAALKAILKWWDEDAQYLTTGDYGGRNVFDEPPEWVSMARKALADEPESKILLATQTEVLTRGDVNILDGSINRSVRIDWGKDAEVKGLYNIYKSL